MGVKQVEVREKAADRAVGNKLDAPEFRLVRVWDARKGRFSVGSSSRECAVGPFQFWDSRPYRDRECPGRWITRMHVDVQQRPTVQRPALSHGLLVDGDSGLEHGVQMIRCARELLAGQRLHRETLTTKQRKPWRHSTND